MLQNLNINHEVCTILPLRGYEFKELLAIILVSLDVDRSKNFNSTLHFLMMRYKLNE
jgi:hypothetical protein